MIGSFKMERIFISQLREAKNRPPIMLLHLHITSEKYKRERSF